MNYMVGELYLNNAVWKKWQKGTEGDLGSSPVTSFPKVIQQNWLQVLEESGSPPTPWMPGEAGGQGHLADASSNSPPVSHHKLSTNRPQSKENGAVPQTTH